MPIEVNIEESGCTEYDITWQMLNIPVKKSQGARQHNKSAMHTVHTSLIDEPQHHRNFTPG